ncbi:hypothetical protein HHI36_004263 [Cryptolaemus montrouzieri]|uniref:No apical meristem-associated C-terminal domain-containing protein n=1 Tax=Cryptolaemus montrouzieri TaxID=559131 RepID=A0ABD2NQZ1_9CUCU
MIFMTSVRRVHINPCSEWRYSRVHQCPKTCVDLIGKGNHECYEGTNNDSSQEGFNLEDKVKNTTAQQEASHLDTAFMAMVDKCCPLKKRMAKKTEIKVKSSAALVKIKQQLDILATAVSVTEEERLYDAYKRMKLEEETRMWKDERLNRAHNKQREIWKIINEDLKVGKGDQSGTSTNLKAEDLAKFF